MTRWRRERQTKLPNFTFYVERKQATTKLYSHSELKIMSPRFQLQKDSPILDLVSELE